LLIGLIAALLAIHLLAPLFIAPFYVGILTKAIIFGMFAVSVDIALGYSGLITLGPAAFFGIGAYSVAKVMVDFGGSFSSGVVLGILLAGIVAFLIGYPSIRLDISGAYFVLFTLAFGVIVYDFTTTASAITGGSNGLGYVSLPTVVVFDLSDRITYYYFVTLLGVLVLAPFYLLLKSDYGTILKGIRQNKRRMRAMGYNTRRELLIAWILSCSLSAFAGALYVGTIGLASPDLVSFGLTGEVLIWVIIGGVGTFIGPFIAGVGFVIFESALRTVFPELYLGIIGLIFVIFVFVLPEGLFGFFLDRRERE
jgi:ABC-type branched-subunit amino acid transport system permease subunit